MENNKQDRLVEAEKELDEVELDALVRKIFEIVDTYYIEYQAEEIKALLRHMYA